MRFPSLARTPMARRVEWRSAVKQAQRTYPGIPVGAYAGAAALAGLLQQSRASWLFELTSARAPRIVALMALAYIAEVELERPTGKQPLRVPLAQMALVMALHSMRGKDLPRLDAESEQLRQEVESVLERMTALHPDDDEARVKFDAATEGVFSQ